MFYLFFSGCDEDFGHFSKRLPPVLILLLQSRWTFGFAIVREALVFHLCRHRPSPLSNRHPENAAPPPPPFKIHTPQRNVRFSDVSGPLQRKIAGFGDIGV